MDKKSNILNLMGTYRISLWNRLIFTFVGFIGILLIFPIILKFPGFNMSLFPLFLGVIFIIIAISGWLTKVVLDQEGIKLVIPNYLLFPESYSIAWNQIKSIRRTPKGIFALFTSRYRLPLGLEIEFNQGSNLRLVDFNISNFSNKEGLLTNLYQLSGKMDETPKEMIKSASSSFLSYWAIYLIFILAMLVPFFLLLLRI